FQMQFNPKKMAQGEIELGEIHISHPTLRLKQRRDGTWNLQRLLVSPWPGPWLEHSPPIVIQNGRVELAADDEAASDTEAANGRSAASLTERSSSAAESGASRSAFSQALMPTDSSPQVRAFGPILHDLSLSIEPAGKFLYKFEGTARSDN